MKQSTTDRSPQRRIAVALLLTAVWMASTWFVLYPVAHITWTLQDPAWRNGQVPAAVSTWHRSLSDRVAPWAQHRLASKRAENLSLDDISGTEWPMFSAVFYLWATEAVQAQWEQGNQDAPSPAKRAAPAIEAAAALIADPGHAGWVRQHWGDDYLYNQNLFYRMLLIAGLDSFERITGDPRYQPLLVAQADGLAAELAASPYGVVEDYPGQSYSVDVLLAYAAIARVHRRLDRLDPDWIERSKRAFSAGYSDTERNLPAYAVDAASGQSLGWARGVGLSMMLCHAHELWPSLARQWHQRYTDQYWQERWGLVGFREFPRGADHALDWYVEVDAGPVLAGFGIAANGFGLGALRTQGDMDRAYSLSAQALLASWPLPNGTLLGPRLLSNLMDAPFTGEAAMLFAMSRSPQQLPAVATTSAPIPVWVALILAAVIGVLLPLWLGRRLLRTRVRR